MDPLQSGQIGDTRCGDNLTNADGQPGFFAAP
jgi:hypothetical protein